MELLIVTGLSGAGKSKAIQALEDISFYCIDNIPPELIHQCIDICRKMNIDRIALVVDIRGGKLFNTLFVKLREINEDGISYKVLFLDARDEVLIRRYKETRRKHPLIGQQYKTIEEAIQGERDSLKFLKDIASYTVDTSEMSAMKLKEQIISVFLAELKEGMLINCMSFGFKNGVPKEADLVFDVRFLPNPFYILALKNRTGLEKCVQDYVMKSDQAKTFKDKLIDMIDYLIPLYKEEGKSHLVIAVGCTGGMHRSVTFTQILGAHLQKSENKVVIIHRDIDRE